MDETNKGRSLLAPQYLKIWIMVLAVLALVGCTGLSKTAITKQAQHKQGSETQRKLPKVELSKSLVYEILLGEIARQRNQPEIAAQAIMRAAQESRDPRLVERAARLAVFAKRQDDAIKAAHLWVELEPDSPQPHETLGALLAVKGLMDEASSEFHVFLKLHGDNLQRAFRRISKVLRQTPDRGAAIGLMQSLVSLHPKEAAAHLALARLAGVDVYKVAIAAVNYSLVLRPDWETAALYKSHLLLATKRFTEYRQFSQTYLDDNPSANRLRVYFARGLLDQGDHEAALKQFKEVVAQTPKDGDAAFAVGLLSIQTKEYEDAETYLKQALKISPANDQARLYLGQLAIERKHYKEAINWYQSVESSQLRFEAQLRSALAMAGGGDVDGADKHLDGLEPTSEKQRVNRYLTKEQILREAGRLDEAMAFMNEALHELPENKDLLYARALLAAQLNMIAVHEQDMRRVLAKDPKNANALNALGYTLADQTDRYKEAYDLVEKALKLKPGDPYILDSMGWVQYRLGKNDEALKYLRLALTKRRDAEIAAHLGEVLWVTGDKDAARSVWDRALKDSPDNDVLKGTLKKFNP